LEMLKKRRAYLHFDFHTMWLFVDMEHKGLGQWVVGCYVVALVGEAHIRCDALREEYMWEHGKNNIWGERQSDSLEKYGGAWHLASTLVVACS
jgi:hypothetical protein